jgi:hypothetical protein
MRVAENECEGDYEELIAEVVADVQHPFTPIFETARLGQGLHDLGRVITRLNQVVDHGASAVDENLLRVGAVEIHLGHAQLPANRLGGDKMSASLVSSTGRPEHGSSDAVKI